MPSPNERTASPFLIKRGVLPASPRAALRELQPRIEQSRADLVRTLRAVARELEHEADQVAAGAMRPTHHLIGPYAAMLDKMRAEANLLREWTQVLSAEIVGPITPYRGNLVIPLPVVLPLATTRAPVPTETPVPEVPSVPADAGASESANATRGSIASLMDELASNHHS